MLEPWSTARLRPAPLGTRIAAPRFKPALAWAARRAADDQDTAPPEAWTSKCPGTEPLSTLGDLAGVRARCRPAYALEFTRIGAGSTTTPGLTRQLGSGMEVAVRACTAMGADCSPTPEFAAEHKARFSRPACSTADTIVRTDSPTTTVILLFERRSASCFWASRFRFAEARLAKKGFEIVWAK